MANPTLSIMSIAALAIVSGAALAVEVTQDQSGQVAAGASGKAPPVTRYTGGDDRVRARIVWTGKAGEGRSGFDPGNYAVGLVKTGDGLPGDLIGPLPKDTHGFDARLEKNRPFAETSGKMVGLYVPEWTYWERAWPADFTPAKNVTHVFYSFMGICDYGVERPAQDLLPSENNGLAESNPRGQKIIRAMCGQGNFPMSDGREESWQKPGSSAQRQGDFNLTKYDPVASHFMLDAMKRMKEANPKLKVMLSVGGWTLSSPFHGMVETKAGREIFIASVVRFLQENNELVDGIDLDWEFPGGGGVKAGLGEHGLQSEKDRYTELVLGLREALDRHFTGHQRKLLSAAVSASPAKLAGIDFNRLAQAFDFVNVMSYDLYGAFTNRPSHQAALHAKPVASPYGGQEAERVMKDEAGREILIDGNPVTQRQVLRQYSTEGAIDAILEHNPDFPSEKLNVGVAAYGRGWHSVRVRKEHDKLFWHGIAAGASVSREGLGTAGTWENSVTDFRDLYDHYMVGNAAHLYYDTQAQAAYTWQPAADQDGYAVASVNSFDDPRSVIAKGEFIKQRKLGGIFAWDASTDNGLLTNAMNAAVCNQLEAGGYYTFEQQYRGQVTTRMTGSEAAPKVDETVSGPFKYRFDKAAAKQLCESGEPPVGLPAVTVDPVKPFVTGLGVASTIKLRGSATAAAGAALDAVRWSVDGAANGIVIKSAQHAETDVVLPPRLAARDYRFTLLALDNRGQEANAHVTLSVANPYAKIAGRPAAPVGSTARYALETNLAESPSVTWRAARQGGGAPVQHGSGAAFAFKPAAAGNYVVAASVKDARGRTAKSQRKVEVRDQAAVGQPTVTLTGGELAYGGTHYMTVLGAKVSGKNLDPRKLTYAFRAAAGVELQQHPDGDQVKVNVIRTAADQSFDVTVSVSGPGLAKPVTATRTLKLAGTDTQDAAFLKTLKLTTVTGVTHFRPGQLISLAIRPVSSDSLQMGRLAYEWRDPGVPGSGFYFTGPNGGMTIPPDFKGAEFVVSAVVRSASGNARVELNKTFTVEQSGIDEGNDGSDGNGDGVHYPDFREDTQYQAGDIVRGKDGQLYQCREGQSSAWCGQPGTAGAYGPGQGWAWEQAWDRYLK